MSSQSTSSSSSGSSNSSSSSSDSSSSESERSAKSRSSGHKSPRAGGGPAPTQPAKAVPSTGSSSSSSSSTTTARPSAKASSATSSAKHHGSHSKQAVETTKSSSSSRKGAPPGGSGSYSKSSLAPARAAGEGRSKMKNGSVAVPSKSSGSRHQTSGASSQGHKKPTPGDHKLSKSIFSPEHSSASEPDKSSSRKPNSKKTAKSNVKQSICKRSSSISSNGGSADGGRWNSDADDRKRCPAVADGSSAAATAVVPRIKKEEGEGNISSSSALEDGKLAKGSSKQCGVGVGGGGDASAAAQEEIKRRTRRTRASRIPKRCRIYNTDSDSDHADESPAAGAARRRPAGASAKNSASARPGSRCSAASSSRPSAAERVPVMGEARCPVVGCDSWGHLSGAYDKHFTRAACPQYHNTSDAETKDQQLEREIRVSDRQKALNKSVPGHLSSEQKSYHSKVMSQRRKPLEDAVKSTSSPTRQDAVEREVDLAGAAPAYDIMLFKEAQATASGPIEDEIRELPGTDGICGIEMGKFEMEVWYQAPYPEDFAIGTKIFICEYCLKYLSNRTSLKRHTVKCVWRFPPGNEIYRKEKLSVFEVDGRRFKLYCQNLCLLAKLFLDNKTLYFDVEPFLFYVMTVSDSDGCHIVGYFSKEKNSFLNFNVSCILTLPPYQRQGFGRLLIDFSYLLTKVEGKIGSPEKPLSDLGLISYRSYWKDALLRYFSEYHGKVVSIKDLSQDMAANANDIVSTLQAVGIVKYWKNKHIIVKRQDIFEDFVDRRRRRGPDSKEIDAKCLVWTPFQVEKNQTS